MGHLIHKKKKILFKNIIEILYLILFKGFDENIILINNKSLNFKINIFYFCLIKYIFNYLF